MTKLYLIKMDRMRKFVVKVDKKFAFSSENCSLFDENKLKQILIDLENYGYDEMKVVCINGF